MPTLHVKVTQAHINRATKGNCWNCPIALALLEQPRVISARVIHYITLLINMKVIDIDMPDHVAEFAASFDRGEGVKPFEFNLELPEEKP